MLIAECVLLSAIQLSRVYHVKCRLQSVFYIINKISGVTVSRVFQKMIIAECVLHYQLSVCSAAVKSKTGKMIIAEFVPLYQLTEKKYLPSEIINLKYYVLFYDCIILYCCIN